jgi:hypothetical protein
MAAGWHLKEVTIKSQADGRQWLCECNQWFAKDEADKRIERELIAVEQSTTSHLNVGQAATYHNTNTNTLNYNQYKQPDNTYYGSQVKKKRLTFIRNYRKEPIFGNLVLSEFFLKGVPGTKCCQRIFEKIFVAF